MSAQRVFGFSLLLCMAAACTPQHGTTAPRPLKPEEGPKVSLRVGYSGGLVSRTLSAYFRTEQNAFVVVGHLGGDGVIRVLYPSRPYQAGFVRAKKTNQTRTVSANYDGIPSMFSYTMSPFRSLSALYDSYDGRGHGYVFIVASRLPLASALVSDEGEWDELNVADYSRSYDPRLAIRDFADVITDGAKYTLKFASSFNTSHYDALASRAWDCALLSNLGYFSFSPFWNSWNSALWGLRSSPANYCGSPSYRSYTPRYATTYVPTFIPTRVTPGTPAPTLSRPGRRPLGEPGPAAGPTGRSSLTRVGATTRMGPSGGGREFGERRSGTRPTTESVTTATPSLGSRHSRPAVDRPTTSRPSDASSGTRTSSGSTSTGPTSAGSTERSAPTRTETPRMSSPRESSPRETRTPDKPDKPRE